MKRTGIGYGVGVAPGRNMQPLKNTVEPRVGGGGWAEDSAQEISENGEVVLKDFLDNTIVIGPNFVRDSMMVIPMLIRTMSKLPQGTTHPWTRFIFQSLDPTPETAGIIAQSRTLIKASPQAVGAHTNGNTFRWKTGAKAAFPYAIAFSHTIDTKILRTATGRELMKIYLDATMESYEEEFEYQAITTCKSAPSYSDRHMQAIDTKSKISLEDLLIDFWNNFAGVNKAPERFFESLVSGIRSRLQQLRFSNDILMSTTERAFITKNNNSTASFYRNAGENGEEMAYRYGAPPRIMTDKDSECFSLSMFANANQWAPHVLTQTAAIGDFFDQPRDFGYEGTYRYFANGDGQQFLTAESMKLNAIDNMFEHKKDPKNSKFPELHLKDFEKRSRSTKDTGIKSRGNETLLGLSNSHDIESPQMKKLEGCMYKFDNKGGKDHRKWVPIDKIDHIKEEFLPRALVNKWMSEYWAKHNPADVHVAPSSMAAPIPTVIKVDVPASGSGSGGAAAATVGVDPATYAKALAEKKAAEDKFSKLEAELKAARDEALREKADKEAAELALADASKKSSTPKPEKKTTGSDPVWAVEARKMDLGTSEAGKPFTLMSVLNSIMAQGKKDFADYDAANVPPVATMTAETLVKNLDSRYANADEMKDAITTFLHTHELDTGSKIFAEYPRSEFNPSKSTEKKALQFIEEYSKKTGTSAFDMMFGSLKKTFSSIAELTKWYLDLDITEDNFRKLVAVGLPLPYKVLTFIINFIMVGDQLIAAHPGMETGLMGMSDVVTVVENKSNWQTTIDTYVEVLTMVQDSNGLVTRPMVTVHRYLNADDKVFINFQKARDGEANGAKPWHPDPAQNRGFVACVFDSWNNDCPDVTSIMGSIFTSERYFPMNDLINNEGFGYAGAPTAQYFLSDMARPYKTQNHTTLFTNNNQFGIPGLVAKGTVWHAIDGVPDPVKVVGSKIWPEFEFFHKGGAMAYRTGAKAFPSDTSYVYSASRGR